MENSLIIHSDGGARGNPGPGACAFVAEENSRVVEIGSKYLGEVTNNFAEYSGVILALGWLTNNLSKTNHKSPIIFFMDSELVVRQITGAYKVKDEELKVLCAKVKDLLAQIPLEVVFNNIPREKNKLADSLVNKELDKIVSGKIM